MRTIIRRIAASTDLNGYLARRYPALVPYLLAVNLVLDGAAILFLGAVLMTWIGHGWDGQAIAITVAVAAYLRWTTSPMYAWAEIAWADA
jgi:hypothetical protein